MALKIVTGDLFKLDFDVIAHGCNCQSRQKSGIAAQMVARFSTDKFKVENMGPGKWKLGTIDYMNKDGLWVVNCYTQEYYGTDTRKINYGALASCLNLLVHAFPGQRIGLPWIGCGLAGGDKEIVQEIVGYYARNADITIVEYER